MKEIAARIKHDIKDLWMAIIVLVVYTVLVNVIFHAFCPMVIVTGLPCPGCGMTRALFYLATGRLHQSIQMNPMGIPIACIILYFCWNRYIIGKKAKGMMLLVVVSIVLLLIVYVWRMYCFFPNRVPYVYAQNNVLSKAFPFYEQMLYDLKILW